MLGPNSGIGGLMGHFVKRMGNGTVGWSGEGLGCQSRQSFFSHIQ